MSPQSALVSILWTLSQSSFFVGIRKVHRMSPEKCTKGTPAVHGACLEGTRLSIVTRDYLSWTTSRRLAWFPANSKHLFKTFFLKVGAGKWCSGCEFPADVNLSWSTRPRFVLTSYIHDWKGRSSVVSVLGWWSSESKATVGSTPDRDRVKDCFQFSWVNTCVNSSSACLTLYAVRTK